MRTWHSEYFLPVSWQKAGRTPQPLLWSSQTLVECADFVSKAGEGSKGAHRHLS